MEVDDLVDTMLEYYTQVVRETGHERWQWRAHPRVVAELMKAYSPLARPMYGEPMMFYGVRIVTDRSIEDFDLEETG